jgi:hypothetical protein
VVSLAFALGAGPVRAEEASAAAPAAEPSAMAAAMAKAQQLGSPGEPHKVLESLAGMWSYAGRMWMSPESQPESMAGTSTNAVVFGGRFLKQEFSGQMAGMPPFQGVGLLGYDNIRKEYQSLWYDNMNTALMTGTGQFDPAAKTFTFQGDFSCPMTGEAHRSFRDTWTITDADHTAYASYVRAPDGREYKMMEIAYTRVP